MWILLSILLAQSPSPTEGTVLPKEIQSVQLPIKRIINYFPGNVRLGPDGSVIMFADSTVFHYSSDGTLINKFGRAGEGPGEIKHVKCAVFNGEKYLVTDFNATLHFFDSNGEWISKYPGWVENLTVTQKGNIFATVFDVAKYNDPIQHVVCQMNSNEICEPATRFVQLSEENMGESKRALKHYIAEDHKIRVVGQLDRTIYTYCKKKHKLEGKLSFQLPYWVEGKDTLPKSRSRKALKDYWNSFSRIHGLWKLGDDFLVYYILPDSEHEQGFKSAIATIDENGKHTRSPYFFNGLFLGVSENKLYCLTMDETTEEVWPIYTLRVFKWQ